MKKINPQPQKPFNFLKIPISLFLFLFLALPLVTLAQGPGKSFNPGNKKGQNGKGLLNPQMMTRLNLSNDQKEAIRDHRYKNKKKSIEFQSQIALLEEDLKYLLSKYPIDKKKANAIVEKIAEKNTALKKLRLEGMIHFASLLTEKQHKEFVKLKDSFKPQREKRGKGKSGKGKNRKMDSRY